MDFAQSHPAKRDPPRDLLVGRERLDLTFIVTPSVSPTDVRKISRSRGDRAETTSRPSAKVARLFPRS
jgi:hypothetical protein